MCVLEVAGNETFESFLASSIPELEPDHFATGCDILADEVDTDSRLTLTITTFFVGSNSFLI